MSAVQHSVAPPPDLGAVQALRELDAAREACAAGDAGRAVMDSVRLCAVHGLSMPQWLRSEVVRRVDLVANARVRTWDEALGRPWPKRTRLSTESRNQVKTARVHARAFELVRADLSRPINRDLFEEVGETAGIHMSGSVAEKLYYRAVAEGRPNIATWRQSAIAAAGESPSSR